MKLFFRQKLSLRDSYEITSEAGRTVYTAKASVAVGKSIKVYDSNMNLRGRIREKPFSTPAVFDIYLEEEYCGQVAKDRVNPHYTNAYQTLSDHYTTEGAVFGFDHNGWRICSDRYESVYMIFDREGAQIGTLSKNEGAIPDQYLIETGSDDDALFAVMMALVIDAEKDRRGK